MVMSLYPLVVEKEGTNYFSLFLSLVCHCWEGRNILFHTLPQCLFIFPLFCQPTSVLPYRSEKEQLIFDGGDDSGLAMCFRNSSLVEISCLIGQCPVLDLFASLARAMGTLGSVRTGQYFSWRPVQRQLGGGRG